MFHDYNIESEATAATEGGAAAAAEDAEGGGDGSEVSTLIIMVKEHRSTLLHSRFQFTSTLN